MKNLFTCVSAASALAVLSFPSHAGLFQPSTNSHFKKFSVSVGWLHAMPQGDANPMQNSTAIKNGSVAKNGSVKKSTVMGVIDPAKPLTVSQKLSLGLLSDSTDLSNVPLLGDLSGTTTIQGLESWESPNTGLKANNADTLGLLFNYYFNDHWSIESKAGIPPKVDIKGKGQVYAPFSGTVHPSNAGASLVGDFNIKKDIPITNMEQGNGIASSARAWLPAAEIHYQFGKSGINKFRPYLGLGVMYAYFDKIELNEGIRSDLEKAGHMIQNIKDGKAGAALEGKVSTGKMKVDVEPGQAFAPIATIGATYDFNDKWYAVSSLSYAKLSSDTEIKVKNENTGEELINSKTSIDINPLIAYAGIGYRF